MVAVPPPNSGVVADAKQHGPVPTQTRLPNGRGAPRMLQRTASRVSWLLHFQIPDISASNLISKRDCSLPKVHGKSYKPDIAFLKFKSVQNGRTGLVLSQLSIFQPSRFPADNAVLTTFAQNKITKPFDTIDIVAMNISSRKVREMLQNWIERSTTPAGVAVVRLTDGFLHVWFVQVPEF